MASDAFLKIDGIPGESTDAGFKDQIEVLSYSNGVSMPVNEATSTGGNRTSGRASHSDFSITKVVDKATPLLLIACCKGTHIANVVLTINRAGDDKIKFMEYKMEDVIVSNVSSGGSSGGGLPTESVGLSYGKITWTYTETSHEKGAKGGDISKKWSLIENKGA